LFKKFFAPAFIFLLVEGLIKFFTSFLASLFRVVQLVKYYAIFLANSPVLSQELDKWLDAKIGLV